MNGCIILINETVRKTKFYEALKRRCGNNDIELYSYFTKVATNKGFNDAFKTWYKTEHNTTDILTFDNVDTESIMNDVISYYNIDAPDGNATVMEEYKPDSINYNSAGDKQYAIQYCRTLLMRDKFYHTNILKDNKNFDYNAWKDLITEKIFYALLKRIKGSTNISDSDLKNRFNTDRRKNMFVYLCKDEDGPNLTKERATNISKYIEYLNVFKEVLGENINSQDKNLIALLDDMLDFHKHLDGTVANDIFFDELFNIHELRDLRNNTKTDDDSVALAKEASAIAISDGVDVDEGTVAIDLHLDETIKDYDSHGGEYATFMMHMSNNIIDYFNSLPRLMNTNKTENGSYDYDINNPLGLSSSMTAKECVTLLYSRAKTDGNIEEFIESIREIAERNPGYEGLIKLYWDLKGYFVKQEDPSTKEIESKYIEPMYAFAEELYSVFAKTAIAKKEVYVDSNGKLQCRIVNNATSPRESFRLQCMNSIKYSAVKVITGEAKSRYTTLMDKYKEISKHISDGFIIDLDTKTKSDYNKTDLQYIADRRSLIELLCNSIKWYFPNITLSAILNYVDNDVHVDYNGNSVIDDLYNIKRLINLFNDVIEKTKSTKTNYENIIKEAAEARYDNSLLNEYKDIDPTIDDSNRKDIDSIYAKEYITQETNDAAISIADLLLKYSSVKTELNHRNAEGNNSSDILNNNMLSYLKRIIEHEDNTEHNKLSPLNKFAAYKFHHNQSRQYDGSNILVEHKDENGEIINLGLFRKIVKYNPIIEKTVTTYEPTEYAKDLLKITLFNGVQDTVKKKSALYANMAKGDYIISAITSFFNSNYSDVKGKHLAEYYLRTPSDAPKNFYLSLPRYSTQGLFIVDDSERIASDIESRINRIPITAEYIGGNKYKYLADNEMLDLLINNYNERLYLDKDEYKIKDDIAYVVVKNKDTFVVVKGDFSENAKNKYIENVQIVGVLQNDKYKGLDESTKIELSTYYNEQLYNNLLPLSDGTFAKRRINHNHPIFKQLFNIAKQEVTDAATAVNTLFKKVKRKDGDTLADVFVLEGGVLNWNDTFAASSNPDNLCELNYHRRTAKELKDDGIDADYKGSKVFYKDENGIVKLTGKVFTSDRFTRFDGTLDDSININYLNDLFADGPATEEDGRIHILYGGYNTHLHVDEDGNVILTDAQSNFIKSRIEQFILDYVDGSYKRVEILSDIMPVDTPHTYDNIAEFALNYRLAYYACADLLEGDTKSYKSFADFFKRAKEVQGSGVPYSALDYTKEICGNRELVPYSSLNKNPIIEKLINDGKLHDCKLYTIFRGVTVENTVRTTKGSQSWIKDSLIKAIEHTYKETGMPLDENKIKEKAASVMKGFDNVKTNDAQSYITLEEWIRRISMRGQLPKYIDLIDRLCDESKPLTINDITEFVQVQKNFYYDLYYDEKTRHMRARQIKNAEFVLVPRLIKGTQLEEVYNTMIEHGIDQLNTVEASKAGKSNILTLWDNDGNLSKNWFSNKDEDKTIIKNAIEHYDYNFLYTQQETPQHVADVNKAALPFMKRIIDNIPQFINGKEHPLWKAKQTFQKLYAQNIKESNKSLLMRLNVQYNKDGNFSISDTDGILGLDVKVFCDMLRDELLRQAQDSDMLDYVTLNQSPVEENLTANGFGLDTKMPIIANNAVRKKFENVAQALFNNNITRQTLPGFHAAQITDIGWKNEKSVTYNLLPEFDNKTLKQNISGKEWSKLSSTDKVKYIPTNGIGLSDDLAYHPAEYKHKSTGKVILEKDYLNLSEKEQKNYTLNGCATYIEVRVPKSVFTFDYYKKDEKGNKLRLKTNQELLNELRKEGLDEFVGYRIPTEGKQSMAIMKVVDFIDDSYGSTIVVPDGWVAQTGSDFDIDSVYSFVFNTKINKRTGQIEKIKYIDKFDKNTYISYIRKNIENKYDTTKTKKHSIKDLYKSIFEQKDNDYITLTNEESAIYDFLPLDVQDIIKNAQEVNKAGLSKQEIYLLRGENIIKDLSDYLELNSDLSEDVINNIKYYIDVKKNLQDVVKGDSYKEIISEGIDNILDDIVKNIEEKAKELNLPTYEEYLNLNSLEKNSKEQRSNKLLSVVLDILKSDWSLEENLSQSNFREVVNARDELITKRDKLSKQYRSPYDFLDQADNMEEAISGRALKGISVAYDGLVSVCSSAKTTFTKSNEITIIYPITKKYKDGRVIKLDINTLRRRFNEFETDENGKELLSDDGTPIIKKENVKILKDENGNDTGKVAITHTRFGWTNDNKTVSDFLLTNYCAQTTAHQLDIIKEGGIPNVNTYTFTVYKLFPAIGSDYDTAVAFMMQPGVKAIVDAYNNTKSVYSNIYQDPIKIAITNIAKNLNSNINTYYEAVSYFDELLKNNKIPNVLDYDLLKNRLNEKENAIFDYFVINKFKELKNISDKINAYSFVINPDKYGAKQTIFATNEILDKIGDILSDSKPVFAYVKNAKGEEVHFLDSVFPNISDVFEKGLDYYIKESDDEASVNLPLHYFMKYSTIPSIIVNRRLFQTQDPRFRNIVNSIKNIMSGKNPTLTEDTEDSFTSYIISYLYNNIDIISKPIDFDYTTGIIKAKEIGSMLKERARIYGFFEFGKGVNFKIKVGEEWKNYNPKNKANPTELEVIQFMRFTPAQKVAYIQENFANSLACKYITANLLTHNKYDKINPDGQSVRFNEEKEDIDTVREEFRKMFTNKNPLLRLTAMDLIKYAYIVEGRSRARNTIGKMIPNSILLESVEKRGTGIIDAIKYNWDLCINNATDEVAELLIECYVRSHPTMKEIHQCTFYLKDIKQYFTGKNKVGDMLTIFDVPASRDFIIQKGIAYEDTIYNDEGDAETILVPNSYVNVTTYKNNKQVQTLYKIETGVFPNQYVLYPLNKLETNEFNKLQSSNFDNNKYYFSRFYKEVINNWKKTNMGLGTYYDSTVTEETKELNKAKKVILTGSTDKQKTSVVNSDNKDFFHVVDRIREFYNGFVTDILYLEDTKLEKIIKKAGSYVDIEVDGVRYRITKTSESSFDDYKHGKSAKGTSVEKIVDQIRDYGGNDFSKIYSVVPIRISLENDDVRSSTVIEKPLIECAEDAQNFIKKLSIEGNKNAMKTHKINTNDGVFRDDIDPKKKLEKSLVNTKEWLAKEVEALINGDETRPGFNMFWKDHVTNKTYKMTDAKVFAEMLHNPILHRSFLKTYLDALRLIDIFAPFDYSVYTDSDKGLEFYVNDIKSQINRLKNNPIFKEAEKLYVTEHLAKVSKNPNIQQNIISLLDGYHTTSFITAHINDLQDTSNPIIQLITKQVMSDIRAKELQAEEYVKDFDKKAQSIIKKAINAGLPINFDKFINSNGEWIEDFNDKLREDLSTLYANMKDAYDIMSTYKEDNVEKVNLFEKYLQAKYDYDKFLLKHINREIEDNYYHELLQNLDTMRYPDGRFLEIYVEYEMLLDKKRNLAKQSDYDGNLDLSIVKEIEKVDKELERIVSYGIVDEYGSVIYKHSEEFEEDYNPSRYDLINTYEQTEKLNKYLATNKSIREEYIKSKQKDSFKELLDKYLEIINRIEDRDPITHLPKKSGTELYTNDEYARAKAWIRENTIFKYGISKKDYDKLTYDEATEYLNKYFEGEIYETNKDFKYVIAAASKYFEYIRKNKQTVGTVYKALIIERNARDEYGVVDGRKFSKKDLIQIKKEQLERFGVVIDDELSERAIIRNSSEDDIICKKSFYDKMKIEGITNPVYQNIVKRINNILRKAFDRSTKTVNTAKYLNERDLEDLLKLLTILKYNVNEDHVKDLSGLELLNFIDSINTIDVNDPIKHKLGIDKLKAKKVFKFIKQNVDFKLSEEDKKEFEVQSEIANKKGNVFEKLWKAVNEEQIEDSGEYIPNHLLWGRAMPKEKVYDTYVDKRKTAAIRATKYVYNIVNTKYYEEEQARIIKAYGSESEEYKEWYNMNHIYNPNTHTFEALACWTKHEINPNINGEYIPTYNMMSTSVRDNHKNKAYRQGLGYINNYKKRKDRKDLIDSNKANFKNRILQTTDDDFIKATSPDGLYDNNITLSAYEEEMKNLMQETILYLAKTESAKKHFSKYVPIRANSDVANKSTWLMELAKTFGVVDSNRNVYWNGDDNISYDSDYIPPMPMTQKLTSKDTVHEPIREKYKNDEEYKKALEAYNNHKREIDKKNEEIHKSLIDKDWISVLKEFIRQAGHYNAIQDNKYQLYFGQLLLSDIKNYVPRNDNHNKLKKTGALGPENEPMFLKKEDVNLKQQYNVWLNRLIFNHYKQSQGIGEKIGNILQGFTSSSYMTLNLRAGIANILVGDANILGEAFAKEYFGIKEWLVGKKLWSQGIIDYMANAYNDKADTKVGAIAKGMHILDYNELNGRITQIDLKKWSQIVTDLGFSFNNAGEHLLQVGAMFSMMYSHRVIENPNRYIPGEPEYIVVNFQEYTQNVREQILREVCTPNQKKAYDEFIKNIKKDPNGAKNFAWFREDPVSKFILRGNFNKEQIKEFKDKVESRKKDINKTFETAKSVFDQLDKDENGYMCFAKGSIFESLNNKKDNEGLSEAYKLLGEFKGRVISVNKKIHGYYGKLDAAQIEKFYLGRLLMQYHKHIPTSIAKRYRREGYFNEERGTVEKGMYTSLYDFLTYPIKNMRDRGELSENEYKATKGIKNLFNDILEYFRYLAIYSDVMADYDKNNLRRMKGNILAMLFAIGCALLLKLGFDDDDQEDSITYNLLIYEMDRLASEAAMWNPYGLFNEAKKQWSSPIAAGSIVSDCMKVMETISGIILYGDDYDPYYHTGRYAGKHKLGVYFERRIPYYRNYAMLRDIADNNHYYKIGDNLFTAIPIDEIAKAIKEK